MPVLDCSVKSCYYNKESKCCLDGIHVEGHQANQSSMTACGSFRPMMKDQYTDACKCETNPTRDANVRCEAVKCMFNEGDRCKASHIGITGGDAKDMRETECASFVCENC